MNQIISNVLMQPKTDAVEHKTMTTEQKYAQGILEQATSWLQQTQNGLMTGKEYQAAFNSLVDIIAYNSCLKFDPNEKMPYSNETVMILLLADYGSDEKDDLKKVCYEVSCEDGHETHWFSQDGEFFCEVDDVAFWWRLPNMPESDEYSEVQGD